MSHPTPPDWRRMPASAVRLQAEGPDFVRLRAEDARRYAEECREERDRAVATARSWGEKTDEAVAEALQWERAAEAFAAAWPTQVDEPTDEQRTEHEVHG